VRVTCQSINVTAVVQPVESGMNISQKSLFYDQNTFNLLYVYNAYEYNVYNKVILRPFKDSSSI